jgi:hypothetical protein
MWAPRCRSANSIAPAAVSTGKAMSTRMLVTSMFQVNTGIRNIVMPGARMVRTVATMLTPVSTPERPVRTIAAIHRSAPTPGALVLSDSGAVAVHPKSAAPLAVRNPASIVSPPNR